MLDTTGALQHVQSGKMRALAIATKKRSPILPDVPTFDEAGIPDVYFGAWYGVLAPAGTPKEIITRLNTELNEILRDPATRKRFLDLGAEVGGGTTEEFATFMAAETARFGPLLKNAGIKLD
jgi:tripartite-type tricarboxylate transporter receptor subunit TctC